MVDCKYISLLPFPFSSKVPLMDISSKPIFKSCFEMLLFKTSLTPSLFLLSPLISVEFYQHAFWLAGTSHTMHTATINKPDLPEKGGSILLKFYSLIQ